MGKNASKPSFSTPKVSLNANHGFFSLLKLFFYPNPNTSKLLVRLNFVLNWEVFLFFQFFCRFQLPYQFYNYLQITILMWKNISLSLSISLENKIIVISIFSLVVNVLLLIFYGSFCWPLEDNLSIDWNPCKSLARNVCVYISYDQFDEILHLVPDQKGQLM